MKSNKIEATVEPCNLNKEEFWNNIVELYPKAGKRFCDWIDSWKESSTFNTVIAEEYRKGELERFKFHDLPFEMQEGIIRQFLNDHHRGTKATPVGNNKFIFTYTTHRLDAIVAGLKSYVEGFIESLSNHFASMEDEMQETIEE